MRRIAVVLGGRSSEHDISIASARSVIGALEEAGNEVLTVAIDRGGTWALGDGTAQLESGGTGPDRLPKRLPGKEVAATLADVDVVFPVLHGPFGEIGRASCRERV